MCIRDRAYGGIRLLPARLGGYRVLAHVCRPAADGPLRVPLHAVAGLRDPLATDGLHAAGIRRHSNPPAGLVRHWRAYERRPVRRVGLVDAAAAVSGNAIRGCKMGWSKRAKRGGDNSLPAILIGQDGRDYLAFDRPEHVAL